MAKLFNKIRKELINKGNFFKYSKYAIGEIVLVVVGILIALSINNWNETRIIRNWEQQFLNDLLNEMRINNTQLTEVIEFQSFKKEATSQLLELLENQKEEQKELIDSLYYIMISGNRTFFPTSGVYHSGLSSGKLENIQNDELKYAIMNLYDHYFLRLIYNGEVFDERVEKIAWERRLYFDKKHKKIRSFEDINNLDVYTHVEFLNTQNEIYVDLAKTNLEQMEILFNQIKEEIR
ncbi:MAG: DUF6090 family protein [Cyclobacteriaceae bacterium]|nr:DUF6090 family protein [Cyclobacteriaceae bacterium]